MKKHWLGLVLSLCSGLACAVTDPENMSHEILRYINQYRQSQGLPHLKMSEAVSEEATRHSREMARHEVPFGHTGFSSRIHRVYDRVNDAEAGAENVAYNYKTARIVVDGWIKSPGHRHNIVGRYDLTGIGIVRDKAGKPYYTQLFVRTHPPVKAAAKTAQSHHRVRFTRFGMLWD
jgi:uncharacterized protein YkwD